MIPTPSPITPTPDQAAAIAYLEAAGALYGVQVDVGPLDTVAHCACEDDWDHGLAEVATPGGYLCLACAVGWLRWHPGELVSPEVLRTPPAVAA